MSDTEDSTNEIRESAISVLTALLYSLAIIKGDNELEQLSNFLDIILKSWYFYAYKEVYSSIFLFLFFF